MLKFRAFNISYLSITYINNMSHSNLTDTIIYS